MVPGTAIRVPARTKHCMVRRQIREADSWFSHPAGPTSPVGQRLRLPYDQPGHERAAACEPIGQGSSEPVRCTADQHSGGLREGASRSAGAIQDHLPRPVPDP
ncbi:hypothetical protein SDC9_155694 [bioreactor metagenome]|uniref:Uncharacterized protein n=1 Tax=bioreactor metagenome TaxID=1076179 RepID=A0A645F4G7_9ZZZZ